MAASSSRGGDRSIHQDYIARIRYSNTLPPPPNPPKLLDIPNTGLASGQYTAPGFASRLAREQPLNIEADAELGMPLDLVGMPGIFDGDESSIQAPLHPPAPHPHDRVLLRPLSSLGKPKTSDSGVSFLRRTEYISSHTGKSRFDSTTSRSLIHSTGSRMTARKLPPKIDKESPGYIKEQVERSFELAAANLKDASRIRHPTKPNLKLLESFPLLPDRDAMPDIGAYIGIKFQTNPVAPSSTYDTRISIGALKSIGSGTEREDAYEAAEEAWKRDPERNPKPDMLQDFEFFIPQTPKDAALFKRKYDVFNADNDAVEYTGTSDDGNACFRFKRLRAYETVTDLGDGNNKYDDELIIAINDGKDGHKQRAAFYYPLGNRFVIRPQRKKNIDSRIYGQMDPADEGILSLDFLDMIVEEPGESEIEARKSFRDDPHKTFEANEEIGEEDVAAEPKEAEGVDALRRKLAKTLEEDGEASDADLESS